MKMDHSNWTLRFPRTTRCDGYAIYVYRKPLAERILIWLLFRWGWALLLVLVFALTGCTGPSDYETDVIVAQDLQDAVMQARGER
jgi:hypothetical protein